MTGRGGSSPTPFTNPVLVGASIVIAIVIGAFLSYNANKGLPFVKTYRLTAEVRDAAELVVGSEVRIGGFRVGQVNGIEAVPPTEDRPSIARLDLRLDGTITGIPAGTVVRIRPRSLLGAKFVELEPRGGRDLPTGATLPLRNARATPELDETFNVFDADTRRGLQDTIRAFGNATAGRGGDLNRSLIAMRRLLPPLQRVTETLADPATDLDGFVDGAARAMAAIAPVAADLGELFDGAATTLAAIDGGGDALERFLAVLPAAEAEGTAVLTRANPVLRGAADLTVALRDGTERLPRTTRRLAGALEAGTRTLRRSGELTRPLADTLRALDDLATQPRTPSALRRLTDTVVSLRPTVRDLEAAQGACNIAGLFAFNASQAISRGDALGTWLEFTPILRTEQSTKRATPDPLLHVTTRPEMDRGECESGNEAYLAGEQVIGEAPGLQPARTEETAPPQDATRRARAAGLLDPVPGASR